MRRRFSWVLSSAALCCFALYAATAASTTIDDDSASNFTARTRILQSTNEGGQDVTDVDAAASTATLKLTSSAFALVVPNTVTLTATVSGATLSGNILFIDGLSILGSVAIKGSKAVLTTSLGAGIHRLTAAYIGTGNEIDSPSVDVVVENSLACN
jgi:hypothetical protein